MQNNVEQKSFPVRYMPVSYLIFGGGRVLDTLSPDAPQLCTCAKLEDAVNIARAMNLAEGYRVE